MSVRTVNFDLTDLLDKGILETTEKRGRSTTYRIRPDLLTEPGMGK